MLRLRTRLLTAFSKEIRGVEARKRYRFAFSAAILPSVRSIFA